MTSTTTPTTPIARLVANLGAPDPRLPAALRGATPDEIDALERLAGQPLPPVYREFLQRMGRGMDWLRPAAARFDIDSLLRHFEASPWRPPAGVLKIGLADDDPFFDIYLEPGNSEGPRVMTMPRGPLRDFEASRKAWRRPLAGSLQQFLGSAAYQTLRFSRWPHLLRAATAPLPRREIERLPAIAAELKLSASWFSNDWVQVYDGQKASVIATQFPGGVLAVDIGTGSAERSELTLARLQTALALPLQVV